MLQKCRLHAYVGGGDQLVGWLHYAWQSSRRAGEELAGTRRGSAHRRAMSAGRWQSLHSALQELWDGNDVTATLDQIYTTEPDLLHSVLPQLTLYLLHSAARLLPGTDPAAAALERQLLSICSSSLPFALELCWLLRAQPLPPPEPRRTCQHGGAPRPAA